MCVGKDHVDICSFDGCELYVEKYNYPCFGNVACSSYYACNMVWHEITYSHFKCTGHCDESCVCAWYWLFTILSEYVVSLEMG